MKKITRLFLLNQIYSNLAVVHQWGKEPGRTHWISSASEYLERAVTIIELLEIEDCGSVGGFCFGAGGLSNIWDRFFNVLKVENTPDDLDVKYYPNFLTLQDYFKPKP